MPRLPLQKLTNVLAATLGTEKSEEVLFDAAARLGLGTDKNMELYAGEVERLLTHLSAVKGVVGLAAQFARRRVRVYVISDRPEMAARPTVGVPAEVARGKGLPTRALIDLFTPTLGEAGAEEIVRSVLRREGLPEESLDREQALRVLTILTESPGLVGVAARFGKARIILRFA